MSDETGREPPLDPAFEKIRRKMVRLLALSIAVLFVGLIAVLSAVVYRSAGPSIEDIAEGGTAPISLPEGARVLESSLDADAILLHLTMGEREELWIVNRRNGQVAARYPLQFGVGAEIPAP